MNAVPTAHSSPARHAGLPGWIPPVIACLVIAFGLVLPGRAEPADPDLPDRAAEYRLPDDPADLIRLDDAMRAFFAARVPRRASLEVRLDAIAAAILGPGGLHFRYDPAGVYAAREAFHRRRGNCVTYALLVVAVAREFGIPAAFNEVRVVPRWSRTGGIVLESRHINVWVEHPGGGYEIDLKLVEDLRASGRSSRVIDDARAFAGAYSNAGVYRLAAGDREAAFPLLHRAAEIDPTFAGGWSNLGSAHLLAGEPVAARACYDRALARDGNAMAALSGLARIEREAGRPAEAERLDRKVARYRDRNPYYHFAMARGRLEAGCFEEARRHLMRAIRLKDDDPEFFRAMAEAARGLGDERAADRWVRRLRRSSAELALASP